MKTTHERLCAILAKDYRLDAGQLQLDARLDALGIDSLGAVELMWNIEDEFKLKLPAEPVPLATVGDVVQFIDFHLVAATDHGRAASRPTLQST
jgi:acyl carrier protein